MYYHVFNYWDLFEIHPTFYTYRFLHASSCFYFLEAELDKFDAHSKSISKYPYVQDEGLEFFYRCYRHAYSLNEEYFEDLINLSWRGIGWAAWLALITPYPQKIYAETLKAQQEACERSFGEKYFNKAMMNCHTILRPHDDYERRILAIAEHFKKQIVNLPPLPIAMRRWPPLSYMQHRELRKTLILKEYRKNGTDAALELYKKTRKYIWDYSYREWLKINGVGAL